MSNYLQRIFDFSIPKSPLEAFIFFVLCNLCVIFCAFLGGLLIFATKINFLAPSAEVLNSFFCLFLSIFILYQKGQTRHYIYLMITFLSFLFGYLGTSLLGLIFTSYLTTFPNTNTFDDSDSQEFNNKYWYTGFALQNLAQALIYKIYLGGWGYAILLSAMSGLLDGLADISGELIGTMLIPLGLALGLALSIYALYFLFKRKWNKGVFFWIFNTCSLFVWASLYIPLFL